MINDKIIQRAVAKLIVNDSADLIKLLRKYQPVSSDISYVDLLLLTQDYLADNQQFAEEFTQLLITKGHLKDYNGNNAVGVFSGITTLVGSVINSSTAKKEANIEQQQLTAQNTQNLMQYMMQEEQNKVNIAQQKSNLIYIAIGSMVLITGLIIFTSKK